MMKSALALGVVVTAFALPARAQDKQGTSDLEGLLDTTVVSAPSKVPETANLAPATSISLSAEDLRRYGIRTIDEAINFLGYGMVAEKSFQSSEVGSRGVLLTGDFGSHMLFMLDGHVLNEQWGAGAYFGRGATIPFELIDHIELVLGPGSVLYGSNAMLGIIHVVTKRAKDFKGAHVVVESEVPVSIRGAAGYGQEFSLFGKPAEVVAEAEYYEQRGPAFDFGPQAIGPDAVTGVPRNYDPNSADRIYPAGTWGGRGDDAYYTRAPSAYVRIHAGDFEIGTRAALYRRSDPTDSGNFDDPNSYEQDRWASIDIKHTLVASAAASLSTRLYGDAYDYNQYWGSTGAEDCLAGQDNGCLWHLRGATQWVGLEPQLSLDWLEDARFVTLLGVDGKVRHFDSAVTFTDNATGRAPPEIGAYDRTEEAVAAYVQQTAWATPWLGLNAGVRLDVDRRFGSHGSPRAALAILPWEGGTLRAIYSEAFRAPSAFELYYYDPDTQLPGGSLKPETVRSAEATIEQHIGTQRVQFGVFRSWWSDLVLVQDLSAQELADAKAAGTLDATSTYAVQARNVSSISNYGLNAGYDGSLVQGRLRFGAGVTEAFARREDAGAPADLLAVSPSTYGNARISYALGGELPTVALAARWVGTQAASSYPSRDFPKPTTEVRLTLSGAVPGLSGLSYRLTGNYASRSRGPYTIGPGTLAGGSHEFVPVDQLRFGVGLQYDFAD